MDCALDLDLTPVPDLAFEIVRVLLDGDLLPQAERLRSATARADRAERLRSATARADRSPAARSRRRSAWP
jgi:hypothetical protein